MWLVIGLGNPGKKYERSRHNVGFRVVDELVRRHGLGPLKEKFKGEVGGGAIAGVRVTIVKPMEFMNLSGFAAQRAVQFHQVAPDHVVVVHDEVDLPFGRLRVKGGGGHGGHNGLRSLHAQLGTADYLRVRVGVGKPTREDSGPGEGRVASHVLGDFSAVEAAELGAAGGPGSGGLIARAADAVEAILTRGLAAAMNQFNGDGAARGKPTLT